MLKQGTKRKNMDRLGACDVCKKLTAIYTCPKCETVTCSVNCVKAHKKELDCDGIRVRTKYVSTQQMGELHLLSDYRLLEDIERCVETACKIRDSVENPAFQKIEVSDNVSLGGEEKAVIPVPNSVDRLQLKPNGENQMAIKRNLGKRQRKKRKIMKQVKEIESNQSSGIQIKGGVTESKTKTRKRHQKKSAQVRETVLNLPINAPIVSKNSKDANLKMQLVRLSNAAKLQGKGKEGILSTLKKAAFKKGIHLSFLPERFLKHMENNSFILIKQNCIYWRLQLSFMNANFHTLTISSCAETTILGELVKRVLKRSFIYTGNLNKKDPLESYRKCDISKLAVMMSADKLPGSEKKFYILDKKKTLLENFVGKCIIEYPQLCIAIEDCFVVSKVPQNVDKAFFGEEIDITEFEDDDDKIPTHKTKHNVHNNCDDGKDRESGELTDSGEDTNSDGENDNSLYNDKEFRSMYVDLLKTFDADTRK